MRLSALLKVREQCHAAAKKSAYEVQRRGTGVSLEGRLTPGATSRV